ESHLRISILVEEAEYPHTERIAARAAQDRELANRGDADALRHARARHGLHPRIEARRLAVGDLQVARAALDDAGDAADLERRRELVETQIGDVEIQPHRGHAREGLVDAQVAHLDVAVEGVDANLPVAADGVAIDGQRRNLAGHAAFQLWPAEAARGFGEI